MKAKRQAWPSRAASGSIHRTTQVNPDDITYIDKVVSTHASIVSRMDSWYTHSRIHHGTVMIDHVSISSFTHLQSSTGGIENIAAKCSHELYAGSFWIQR